MVHKTKEAINFETYDCFSITQLVIKDFVLLHEFISDIDLSKSNRQET